MAWGVTWLWIYHRYTQANISEALIESVKFNRNIHEIEILQRLHHGHLMQLSLASFFGFFFFDCNPLNSKFVDIDKGAKHQEHRFTKMFRLVGSLSEKPILYKWFSNYSTIL